MRSKLDPVHIQQYVFDEETESYKVKLIPTEMSIELDAADGDNIRVIPNGSKLNENDQIMSCVGMKTVCLYGEGIVSISPEDEGDEFYTLIITSLQPKEICARRIKIVGSGKLVMQAV
jgi:hypothetical protein